MIYDRDKMEFIPGIKPGAILKWRENDDHSGTMRRSWEPDNEHTVTLVGVITECGPPPGIGYHSPYLKVQRVNGSNEVYDFWPENLDSIDLVTD